MIRIHPSLKEHTYLVGGAVRDSIMGLPETDRDFVVVATEHHFRDLHPEAPRVGTSFPVFLIDGEEVAMTRTERSTGKGYGDFEITEVGVPIEADLGRRDFTICAIARHMVTGELVDPFDGVKDIEDGFIRAVFEQTFEEDPVRILRAARFAARFGFEIETHTRVLMHKSAWRIADVTKERITLEFEKMYKTAPKPSVFFVELAETGVLKHFFPELEALRHVPAGPGTSRHGLFTAFEHTMEAIDRAKAMEAPFHVFMAVLLHDLGKGTTPTDVLPHHYGHEDRSFELATAFLSRSRFSKRVTEFAPKAALLHMKAHYLTEMSAKRLVKLAKEIGRRDFEDMIMVFDSDDPRELSSPEKSKVIEAMKKVLFETELSFLAEVPPKQRAARAHEALVRSMKLTMREMRVA